MPQTIHTLLPCLIHFFSSECEVMEDTELNNERPEINWLHSFRTIWKQYKMYQYNARTSFRQISLVERFMNLLNQLVGKCLYRSPYMCAQLLSLETSHSAYDLLTKPLIASILPLAEMTNTVFTDDYDFVKFTPAFNSPIKYAVAILSLLSLVYKSMSSDFIGRFIIKTKVMEAFGSIKKFQSEFDKLGGQANKIKTFVVEVIGNYKDSTYSYFQVFKVVHHTNDAD